MDSPSSRRRRKEEELEWKPDPRLANWFEQTCFGFGTGFIYGWVKVCTWCPGRGLIWWLEGARDCGCPVSLKLLLLDLDRSLNCPVGGLPDIISLMQIYLPLLIQ